MDNPDGRDPAQNRFLVINLMRIGGVAMILFAIAILNGAVILPDWAAYLLLALGFVECFIVPQMLARLWSTNDRNPPRP